LDFFKGFGKPKNGTLPESHPVCSSGIQGPGGKASNQVGQLEGRFGCQGKNTS
jgi:hypothetical protein